MGSKDAMRDARPWFRRSALALMSLVGIVGVGLAGSSWLIAYVALHPPSRIVGPTLTGPNALALRDIRFATADGLILRGWHVPGQNGATVILVHGFARDRSELLLEAQWLAERGFGALLFDTRGQGASEGGHIGFGYPEALDVQAAVDFIRDLSPRERIGVMGYSMGAVAGIQAAAADARIQAVLAVSPYANPRELIKHRLGLARALAPFVIWWGEKMTGLRFADLNPLVAVAAIAPRSILILEAGDDAMLPPKSGRQLYAAAAEPKELWSVPGVPHVGFVQTAPDAYRQRMLDFFERFLISGQVSPD